MMPHIFVCFSAWIPGSESDLIYPGLGTKGNVRANPSPKTLIIMPDSVSSWRPCSTMGLNPHSYCRAWASLGWKIASKRKTVFHQVVQTLCPVVCLSWQISKSSHRLWSLMFCCVFAFLKKKITVKVWSWRSLGETLFLCVTGVAPTACAIAGPKGKHMALLH